MTTARPGATPEPTRNARKGAAAQQHLQPADAEHLGLHRDHAAERELETEREDEEHDAEFGEQPDCRVVRHQAERVRSQQHADDQVPEDRWQLKTTHEAQHQQRASEQDQDLRQGNRPPSCLTRRSRRC